MLTGFNNNVTYKNNVYHVQTEGGGPDNPFITTHIYLKGAIVASERNRYEHIEDKETLDQTVMQLMERQHKNMIRSLLSGRFDR